MTLPCIVCDRELESVGGPLTDNQPYAGTTFTSHGHYGSTVFDPMDDGRTRLEINVCDPCLVKAADDEKVLYTRTVPVPPRHNSEFWDGNVR